MGDYIEQEREKQITNGLLDWYDNNKRDLPWRNTRNPYYIWISEIMAQQTRISFMLNYYNRFIKQFPTVQSLAEAEESQVLKAWEGLGYYSRARNLQKAAKTIVSDYDGQMPETKKELLGLSGIGEYTAGAILSIAYNIPAPAVDGNVLRVFSRLEESDADIHLPQTKQIATEFVLSVLSTDRAGSFTQALMELGALVCVPQNPNCFECPLTNVCKAYQSNTQNELPVKSERKQQKVYDKTILIIKNPKGEIMMRQRTEKLLSGLWEFYMADDAMTEVDVRKHLISLGHTMVDIKNAGTAKHIFTHMIWRMQGYVCQSDSDILQEGYQWVSVPDMKTLAMPVAIKYFTEQQY